nr:integrase, catalytic region, zinc finger, CCHC-type, peptidase aspartic, catalytic [Tanacetum cinerariifolium]
MIENKKLDEDLQGKPVDATFYPGMIGSLMYLTPSIPDFIYAVCLCPRGALQKYSTSASGSKPSDNIKNNRISQPSSSNKINKVEDQPRSVKTRKNNKNHVKKVKCDDHVMQSSSNANFVSVSINNAHVKNSVNNVKSSCLCVICGKCMIAETYHECVQLAVTKINESKKSKSVKKRKKHNVWKPTGHVFTEVIQIVLWYLDSRCSKHMTGNRYQLMNFVSKFLGTVRFGNDQIVRIMRYGDYQLGKVVISRVYYVEGIGHYLFSVGQFCDANFEVAFRKNTCFIRDLEGVDLFLGSCDINLYTISLDDMLKSSLICLLSKASKTKSWLWYRRLPHLNFGTLNKLAKDGLARGISGLKFQKDHLCSACALGKSKKSSYEPKAEDNQEKLYLLHMDLCGPMRVASINGKRWTKDHPIENVIGDPSCSVFTRKQLETNAMWCYFDAFLSLIEPKNFKQAMNEPSWIDAMQEEIHEFKRLEVWELVLCPDNVFLIKLKWICNIKKDESGGDNSSHVYKLKKALYGLKQAPRTWYDMLSSFLISQQFSKGVVDPTLFTRHAGNDLLLITNNFKMSMMGQMSFFLELQISQSPRGIFINQSKYASEIIKKYSLTSTDFVDTPMIENKKLDEDLQGKPVDATFYPGMIGSLMYLTPSIPDFIYVVCLCPRIEDQDFDALPSEADTVSFHGELGHTGVIISLNDVVIDQMYQPWRTFAALINRSLSGKTTALDKLHLSRAHILWGMYYQKNVDYMELLWEDFIYQIDNRGYKKQEKTIHTSKDDYLINTLRFISRKEASQKYGAVLPECLTSPQMKESKAYKTYLGYATSTVPPKVSSSESLMWKLSQKEKVDVARGKGIDLLSEVAMTKEAQMKEVRKKSLRDFHKSHPSGSGSVAEKPPSVEKITPPVTSEGTGDKLGVPDVTKDESTVSESDSWGNNEDDSNNEEGIEQENDSKEHESNFEQDMDGSESDSESDQQDNDDDEVKDVDDNDEDDDKEDDNDDDKSEEIVSPLDVYVHHEVPRIHTSNLLAIPVLVIPEASPVYTNIPQLSQTFTSPPLQSTPSPLPTTETTNIPSLILDFASVFRFNDRVIDLEKDVDELKNDPLHTQVTSLVDDHLDTRMGATKQEFMNFLSASLTDKITEQVRNQTPQILPEKVSNFAPPMIEKMIQESLNQVNLAKASSQPQSTYEKATTLTEFKLKILINKMNSSESYLKIQNTENAMMKQKISKDAEPTTSPKTKDSSPMSSKGSKSQPKSSGKSVHAEEPEFEVGDTNTPQGQEGNQGNDNDEPRTESASRRTWFTKPSCPQEPTYLDKNKDKTPQKGPTQNWLMTHAASTSTGKSLKEFDELMSTPIDFSSYILNGLKIKNLTQENPEGGDYPFDLSKPLPLITRRNRHINNDLKYLQGGISTMTYTTSTTKTKAAQYDLPGIEDIVPNIWSPVKVSYDKYELWGISYWRDQRKTFYAYAKGIQSRGDVYSTKRILAVTHVSVMRKHGYGYVEEIVVRRADNALYKFKEGFIYVDDYQRNMLMRSGELYKFSDGTLTRLLSLLEDITKNIDMKYLPKRRWSTLEKKRAHYISKTSTSCLRKER